LTAEEYNALEFDVRDGVAHITLNRPEAGNALNLELAQELLRAVMRCDEEPEVRAVVIAGAGRMFCVGGDLKSSTEQGEQLSYHLKEITTYLHAAIARMARMDPPVVAAVHGAAAGAGLSLTCAATSSSRPNRPASVWLTRTPASRRMDLLRTTCRASWASSELWS